MAYPFKKNHKHLLEKDCEFQTGARTGKVHALRPDGYLVLWDEWKDTDTGEVHECKIYLYSFEEAATDNAYGKLRIIRRPRAQPTSGIRRSERLPSEVRRQQMLKQRMLSIQAMIDSGELRAVRDDFCDKIAIINARGELDYARYLASRSRPKKGRAGSKVKRRNKEKERTEEFHQSYKSGHALWNWFQRWIKYGDAGLFDKYRNCGRHKRYDDATESFVELQLDMLWTLERPTFNLFVESVQAAIDAENDRREQLPVQIVKLKRPGYDYLRNKIAELAPLDHALRRHNRDQAYKFLHPLGMGLTTSRALERVEVDEYTVDLFVLMKATDLFDHLPESIKQLIGLNGSVCRVTLSAAIDVHTRCILALQIVPAGLSNPLSQTLEMIYLDKSPIADAVGATFGWPMAGAPEAIVFDRGDKYITDDAYEILADLGITNLGCPAGKPWLKPFIERVFRTIHSDLLARFSGRTFSNVVERGDYDSAARASLTLEAFLCWLVRWTVDAYHTHRRSALEMSPAQAWEKACKECPPRSLTSAEMREVFGVKMRRKLTRKGVVVNNIHYQSDALMQMFLREKVDELEVLRWDGDIGAVAVRSGGGSWITVPACDERWIGKTDLDLLAARDENSLENEQEKRARRDFNVSSTTESYRMKRLLGLVSLPRTGEELDYETERFTRHVDTAERRHQAGAYRDLMGDLDGISASKTSCPNNSDIVAASGQPEQQHDNDHTME